MSVRLGIWGKGRMGNAIAAALDKSQKTGSTDFELVGLFGSEASKATMVLPAADVWVDFSRPEGTLALLDKVSVRVLIGTTGHSPEMVEKIRAYSASNPVLLAPNTSLGINLLLRLLNSLPPAQGQAVLSEVHHVQKKDSPSGTALAILNALQEKRWPCTDIQSTRTGDGLGEHRIELILEGERIGILHEAQNRSLFALGALKGAAFLAAQSHPRIYSMQEVFF